MEQKALYGSFVKGDEKALESLYDHYFATLSVYASRFLHEEDFFVYNVHESFIRNLEKRKKFKSFHTIVGYLYT